MEALVELKYILFLFWILGGICIIIFFVRKARYKEPDISEYYKLIGELNEKKNEDLELIHKRNKEIDKIEEEILKCKKELGLKLFKSYDSNNVVSKKKSVLKIFKRLILILLLVIILFCIYSFIFHRISTFKENKILEKYNLGKVININGLDINYKIFNEDNKENTIVFLSGLGTNELALSLEPFANKINSKIILINRPGYSLSEDTKEKATLDFVIDYYRSVLSELNINEKIILMPSSLGGLYAIEWINKYPEEIKGLVALDITCPYLAVNDPETYFGNEVIMPDNFTFLLSSKISRMYGVLGIHRQLYNLGLYEKYNYYGFYSEDVVNAMHYISLQRNEKYFMLSENGYLYLNAKEVLGNLGEEYNNIPKLMILANYSSGDFFEKYEKEESLKYYSSEEELYEDIKTLEKIRKKEIEYYNKFDNNKSILIEGPHTIYEYPSKNLINTINDFIN